MPFRFLCLGDSYTIGEGVRPNERWPYQLAAAMRRDGWDIELPPAYVAQTGWTTTELRAALAEANLEHPFDLVTLLAGVNDQYRGRPIEEFRACYNQLLHEAIELAGGKPNRVVTASIPDWGVTSFAIGRDRQAIALEIDAFNAEAALLARRAGVVFVDVTKASRNAGSALGMLAKDGLHPSKFQYGEWARVVRPAVEAALRHRSE